MDEQLQVNFGQYGKSFQDKIMQALLSDKQFAEQMLEVFEVSYFDLKYLQFLADRYFKYAKKYKVFPTLQLLVTIIRDELKLGNDIVLKDQIVDYLMRMKTNPDVGDLQYVKEKSLDFCRKQALKAALENAVSQMQSNQYEQIVESIKKAVIVGTAPAMGHDFLIDYESRFTKSQRNCVPTGLSELDKKEIFNGGIGSGELGCVIASTGVGKCVDRNTYVNVKYPRIKINEKFYKPWERIETRRGSIFARNIVETDELV